MLSKGRLYNSILKKVREAFETEGRKQRERGFPFAVHLFLIVCQAQMAAHLPTIILGCTQTDMLTYPHTHSIPPVSSICFKLNHIKHTNAWSKTDNFCHLNCQGAGENHLDTCVCMPRPTKPQRGVLYNVYYKYLCYTAIFPTFLPRFRRKAPVVNQGVSP